MFACHVPLHSHTSLSPCVSNPVQQPIYSKHPSGVQTNLQQAVSSVGDLPLPVLSAKPNVSPTGSVHGDLPLPVFGQI